MKKIIVIGCPGSGKSRFSRALGEKTGIPVYHLDMMFWNSDKTTVEKSVFLERLTRVMKEDEWRLDGNYTSTLEMRFKECDTVFFLDLPVDVCLEGVAKRRGKPRPDMPWIESEEDAEFTDFIKSFAEKQRPTVLELLVKYADKKITVLQSRGQADKLLCDLVRELS